MTMLITKFNKLIQSKVIWITFSALIVVAFIMWDTQIGEQTRDREEAMSAGKLFGKHVSFDEFRNAYNNTRLQLAMYFGEMFQLTPDMEEEVNRIAWRRLVTLETARKAGINATDEEVVQAIRTHPAFSSNGEFDRQSYDAFLTFVLPQMGFSPRRFEEHIREEIILRKMEGIVGRNVLISPSEVERIISTASDTFTVEYAVIDREQLEGEVRITDQEAREHFGENIEDFKIPERVRVNYVRFPFTDYMGKVEITEEDIKDYYERNIEEFTVYDESAEDAHSIVPEQPLSVEAGIEEDPIPHVDEFQVARTLDLEDVKADIRKRLEQRNARDEAARAATDFMLRLLPDRTGEAPDFRDLAEERGLRVHDDLPPFTMYQRLEEVDAGLEFNRMAFDLRPDPNDYVSNVVMGEDHAYILALDEQLPPQAPDFEDVAEEVRDSALRSAIDKTIRERAASLHAAANEAVREGKAFSEVAEQFDIATKRLTDFTMMMEPEDGGEYFGHIAEAVRFLNAGELSEPVEAGNRFIVAYLEDRKPSEDFQFSWMRPQIIQALTRERRMILFEEWQEYQLQKADFQPREERRRPMYPEDDMEEPVPDLDA